VEGRGGWQGQNSHRKLKKDEEEPLNNVSQERLGRREQNQKKTEYWALNKNWILEELGCYCYRQMTIQGH